MLVVAPTAFGSGSELIAGLVYGIESSVYVPSSGHTAFGGGNSASARKLQEKLERSVDDIVKAKAPQIVVPSKTTPAPVSKAAKPSEPAPRPRQAVEKVLEAAKPAVEKPAFPPEILKQLQAMLAMIEALQKDVVGLQEQKAAAAAKEVEDQELQAVMSILL